MSGASIAAEVAQALREVAVDVGDGEFLVTLTQKASAPVNPWDADSSTDTETELPALVQMFPMSMIDGTLIQMNDRKVMVAATGPVPKTADTLTIAGVVHRIINVRSTTPSGVPLYYEIQARV